MKATLEFDLDNEDDLRSYKLANKAEEMAEQLDDIWECCFRPNNKHGYTGRLQELIDTNPELCYDVIEELVSRYTSIMED
jgi:hypothetical protein